jgi:hypothetical protein
MTTDSLEDNPGDSIKEHEYEKGRTYSTSRFNN